ncbi:hypothetical protein [Streptococcus agalactiae]|uniref:hypothetical protein n=1 Tax=Streptococcus agalactiae TaxID=1311 RepID=UPI001865BB2D|nr:hypothetical protein [Streptococcus agalactiae]MBE3600757.1 hypothetical protein [Streptococcus agalactiae]
MFRIKNQANGKEQDFPNRAALLYGLEGEEERCLQLNMSATFHVFHLDKNETVLESTEITIPPSEGRDVKELLGDFGLKGEEKHHFWHRSKKQTEPRGRPEPSESPVTKARPSRLLKGLVWLVPVVLSLTSLYVSLQPSKTSPQPEQVTKTVVTDHKADVFCRYFIGSYFSQNDSLGDFLAEKLDAEEVKTDKVTPVSVLLESQKITGKTIVLTYVVNVRDANEHVSSKRLTITLKSDKEAKYKFLVTKAPKLTAYP